MKHWSKNCWQNANADDETKKKAPKNTPVGQAWARQQAAATATAPSSTPPPTNAAQPPEASKNLTAAALLAKQDDLLAAALDNPSGGEVDVGRAALAFDYEGNPQFTHASDISTYQDFFD